MSPVVSSTDEHNVAVGLSSSSNNAPVGASKKSPSGRLTSPAAYVFAPSWMSNSKESNKLSSNLAFSSFSGTGSPNVMVTPQRVAPGKYRNPAPRSSNSSPYPGRPSSHKLQPNKPSSAAYHDITNNPTTSMTATTTTTNTTVSPSTTMTNTNPSPAIPTTTTPTNTSATFHRTKQPDINTSSPSSSLRESEFPTLVEETASDKRNNGRSAWSNPNAIKAKVLCPPVSTSDENEEEIVMSPYDIELERLKALVPKRRQGYSTSSSGPSSSSSSSKRHSHHHHHHHHHHHQQQHNNNNNNNSSSHNNSQHYHHHPSSPLISPTPSRSLSSSQRIRSNNNKPSTAPMRTSMTGNSYHHNSNNSGGNSSNSNNNHMHHGNMMRISPLTKVPLQMSSKDSASVTTTNTTAAAVVKIPMTSSSSVIPSSSPSSLSRPKPASSSRSSISSIHSQHSACDQRLEAPPYRICELTDDTTTTSSSSLLESPRTLMDEDMLEEKQHQKMVMEDHHHHHHHGDHVIEGCCVGDHEREHFVSWVRTWACRPAIKAAASMETINARFFGNCGDYSYFGPLGCQQQRQQHPISK